MTAGVFGNTHAAAVVVRRLFAPVLFGNHRAETEPTRSR